MDFIKTYNIQIRIAAAILMLALIAWAPWWLIILAMIAGGICFDVYYEVLIFGVMIDALYGTSGQGIFNLQIKYTLIAIPLFFIAIMLRKRLRTK
ncbi:MAG: hypothetical protein JWO73_788 [Candidatus Taylorbacteria bacterium]|nr:hypothetical protein [Candidatus Taylorbacteria bacterium]